MELYDKEFLYDGKFPNFKKLQAHIMQFFLTLKTKPKKVLEIGIGSKFNTYLLKRYCEVITADINQNLNPDYILDILNPENFTQFKDDEFDIVLICEVLEHIPFDNVEDVLISLHRITNRYVLLSIPNQSKYLWFNLYEYGFRSPLLSRIIDIFNILLKMINKFTAFLSKLHYKIRNKKKKYKFNGVHYWELGIDIYSEKLFKKMLRKYFIILREGRLKDHTWHHFFLLIKK